MTLLAEFGFLDNLDDTSGNGIVPSANFTPTYIDGPTPGTRAIRFSGTNQTIDYGRIGLEPASGGVVTMVWARLFAPHFDYTALVHKTRATDSSRNSISVSDNTVFWMSRWRDQTVFSESGSYLADLGWHHLTNIDADDRYAWFVDGIKVQSANRTGSSPVFWEDFGWKSGFASNMVNYQASSNVAFTGVRIFSGTMSDVEVASWMNTDIVPTGRSGKPKVWNGSSWAPHQAKVWNGSLWVPASMAGSDGEWIKSR